MNASKYFFLVPMALFCGEVAHSVESPKSAAPASYEVSLADGIDFKRPGYPSFIAGVTGIAGYESWGRWTEGNEAILKFAKPLPSDFTIVMTAQGFGQNAGSPLKIRAGGIEKVITIESSVPSTYRILFSRVQGNTITMTPYKPMSPKDLGVGSDPRKLGIGLISLKIDTVNK